MGDKELYLKVKSALLSEISDKREVISRLK